MLAKISHLHVMLTLEDVKITSAWDAWDAWDDDVVKHVILGKVTYACKY
jgi:hypothetical protein